MRYEVFADRVFFLHLGMNFLLLCLTAKLGGYRAGWKRLCSAAALGSLWFLFVFLFPMGDLGAAVWGIKAFLLALGSLGTLCLAFEVRSQQKLLHVGALYIAAACVMGGVVASVGGAEKVWRGEQEEWRQNAAGILLPAAAAAAGSIWIVKYVKERQKQPYWAVTLKEGEAVCDVIAFMDSGNSLYDPVSGRPVCIVQEEVARQLGILKRPENFRLIPYHSIGKQHGLLKAAAVQEMYLQKGEQRLKRKSVLLAVSDHALSLEMHYQMLLHPAILEETKGANHDTESSNAGKDAV